MNKVVNEGYVDSLVTLITTLSTSTNRCGNNFRAMRWQFYTNILQGVDTPAGKKIICCGNNFRAMRWQFYTNILQGVDTPAGKKIICCGNNFCAMRWQFYTNILQGVDTPAGKKNIWKGRLSKNRPRGIFCRDLARNAHCIQDCAISVSGRFRYPSSTTYMDRRCADVSVVV